MNPGIHREKQGDGDSQKISSRALPYHLRSADPSANGTNGQFGTAHLHRNVAECGFQQRHADNGAPLLNMVRN
jgi:hypothetical protein